MTAQFLGVTELEGQRISREQLDRTCHRYHWAADLCRDRDILEVACGAGQGLALLAESARSLHAGDYSPEVLAAAQANFPDFDLAVFGAEDLPFEDAKFDCILLFEALYYVDIDKFISEAARVLRPGGELLIATANKDLYDFNPSPYSREYLGAGDFARVFEAHGFSVSLFGYLEANRSNRQRLLRPIKALASRLGIIPRTMRGKEMLKKLFFGSMVEMPADLSRIPFDYQPPRPIEAISDIQHKVIYCRAMRSK